MYVSCCCYCVQDGSSYAPYFATLPQGTDCLINWTEQEQLLLEGGATTCHSKAQHSTAAMCSTNCSPLGTAQRITAWHSMEPHGSLPQQKAAQLGA